MHNFKEKVSTFINELLTQYGLTQQELAKILDVGLASLSAYAKGDELPRVEVLLRLAKLGGVTMEDIIEKGKAPQKKEIIIRGRSTVGAIADQIHGDVYVDTHVRRVFKYAYQPGDLTDAQAEKIQEFVNEIVSMERTVKRNPKTHAAVWGALRRKFKVPYYRRIGEENFETAMTYLKQWRGRLTKPLSRKDPETYRNLRIKAINTIARKELEWRDGNIRGYLWDVYKTTSMRALTDAQLENLYQRMQTLKRKK